MPNGKIGFYICSFYTNKLSNTYLAVLFDQGSTPSRVDLVTAIRANFDPINQ